MSNGIYEDINYNKELLTNVYLANVEQAQYHWHHEYEIVLVLKGIVQIYYNANVIELTEGKFVLFNSKQVHGVRGITHNICLVIQFNPKIFEPAIANNKLFYFSPIEHHLNDMLKYKYFTNLISYIGLTALKKDVLSNLTLRPLISLLSIKLLEYCDYTLHNKSETSNDDYDLSFNQTLQNYVKAHLTSVNLKQETLSHFGMSEKTMYRYLKSNLGITLKDFIDTERIEYACNLLRLDKNIDTIITECGFTNDTSFYRVFKKNMGVTPKEYREGKDSIFKKQLIQNYINFNELDGKILMESLATEPVYFNT